MLNLENVISSQLDYFFFKTQLKILISKQDEFIAKLLVN